MLLQMASFRSFLWLSNIPLYVCQCVYIYIYMPQTQQIFPEWMKECMSHETVLLSSKAKTLRKWWQHFAHLSPALDRIWVSEKILFTSWLLHQHCDLPQITWPPWLSSTLSLKWGQWCPPTGALGFSGKTHWNTVAVGGNWKCRFLSVYPQDLNKRWVKMPKILMKTLELGQSPHASLVHENWKLPRSSDLWGARWNDSAVG